MTHVLVKSSKWDLMSLILANFLMKYQSVWLFPTVHTLWPKKMMLTWETCFCWTTRQGRPGASCPLVGRFTLQSLDACQKCPLASCWIPNFSEWPLPQRVSGQNMLLPPGEQAGNLTVCVNEAYNATEMQVHRSECCIKQLCRQRPNSHTTCWSSFCCFGAFDLSHVAAGITIRWGRLEEARAEMLNRPGCDVHRRAEQGQLLKINGTVEP